MDNVITCTCTCTCNYTFVYGLHNNTQTSVCTRAISRMTHTLQSTIKLVIGTPTCTSMASNSTSDSKCTSKSTKHIVAALIVRRQAIIRVLITE